MKNLQKNNPTIGAQEFPLVDKASKDVYIYGKEIIRKDISQLKFKDDNYTLLPSNGLDSTDTYLMSANMITLQQDGEIKVTLNFPTLSDRKPNRGSYTKTGNPSELTSEYPIDVVFNGTARPVFILNWDRSITIGDIGQISNSWCFGDVDTWNQPIFGFDQITGGTWSFSNDTTIEIHLKHN